jgi:hypothetical protein
MKDILQFLMIIYSPINSIITILYQLYIKLYNFVISIHFTKKIVVAPASNVNMLNISYEYLLYINQYKYHINFFYSTNQHFIVDILVNYKEKCENHFIWYQSIYNFPAYYNNYIKSFIDFKKMSKK